MIYQQKHNGICVDLAHKYELKLKIKKHQRIKTKQISDQAFKQKQETNKPRKVLLGFVDKYRNT